MTTTPTTDAAGTHPATGLPTTMRAAVQREFGTPAVLTVAEVPRPSPGTGEVLVQVRASSLNALDWHFLTGTPLFIRLFAGLRRPKRTIPGADVAGVVAAVGPGVATVRVGDRVFGEAPGGGCAAYATAKAARIVPLPEGVSFEAAAATPVAGVTALQGLRTHATVQPGDRVLVNGAAGGVGTFAVQIAKALGAEVTAVCSTRNVEMVRSLGADEVVDYTTDDIVPGGPRFDIVFDNVGNHTAAEYVSMLRPDGRYVVITGPKDNRWLGPFPYLMRSRLAFRRAQPSFHQFTASPNHDDLAFLGELLATGQVTPAVERMVGLDGVAEGLAEIGTGHTRAKIVVVPD